MKNQKMLKKSRGITLIALVVTIVVLLILAAVSIAMLGGENGIITQAQEATIKNDNGTVTESLRLKLQDYRIKKQTNEIADEGDLTLLERDGIINSELIIDIERLVGEKLKTGNGQDGKDIYKIEEDHLYYYDKNGDKIDLGDLGELEKVLEPTDPDLFTITDDGTIGIKNRHDYYSQKEWPAENVVIPSEINGIKVKKIESGIFLSETGANNVAYGTFRKIKSIVIPEGVEVIGASAFKECYALEKITLPNSLTTIEEGAFSTCYSLKTINIPDNVTTIGDMVFNLCLSLKTINIPDNLTYIQSDLLATMLSLEYIEVGSNNKNYSSIDGVLFNKEGTILISYPIGSKREEYQIPSSVNTIKSGIFIMNCEEFKNMIEEIKKGISIDLQEPILKKVIIPNSVQTIEANAFGGGTTEHIIKVPYSNEGSRPAGWNEQWNADCSAVIEYTQS